MYPLRTLVLLILLLQLHSRALADHILGGELVYTHVAGNTYIVNLVIYGECSGPSFPHLKSATPHIKILNEKGALQTVIMKEDINSRREITNVCPADEAKTTCKSMQGTLPGITLFSYTSTVEMSPATKWRIIFAGEMDNNGKSQTGYSTAVSNVKSNSGFGVHMYLEATLNNSNGHNTSVQYTTLPTPLYCVNRAQQYNPGAVDPNYDVLAHSMIAPLDINSVETEYIPPYSPTQPFSTQQGGMEFNTMTGQLTFAPAMTQVALVITKTEEYRNGVLIGSTMRAMTFFIMNNCGNDAPYGNIDAGTVSGGMLEGNTVNMCDGTHKVKFRIPARDDNGNNINITLRNIPGTANVTVQDNNTPNPVIDFSWDMHNVGPGNYTFYANYNDGVCPMPGNQVMSYTVRIAPPIAFTHEVMKQTNCLHLQHIIMHTDGGLLPRNITITDANNNVIKTYKDYTGTITDSFKTGLYKVLAYSDYLPCSTNYSFEVKDAGTYPFAPVCADRHHCIGEKPYLLEARPDAGGTAQWHDVYGNKLTTTPTYNTDEEKEYKWVVNQLVKVCESVYDTVTVSIHAYPDVKATTKGGHACIGDGMYLHATGAVRYEWQPADKIVYYNDSPFTYVYGPATYTVKGYSEYNCAATDTLAFDYIEQCCLFSYPNAFTPNSDGVNDGWHPVTYGNVDFYLLSIYNRWGQRVFTSSNPKERWNGQFGGQSCDVGTYNFQLKARCVTGHEEKKAGSFTLLR